MNFNLSILNNLSDSEIKNLNTFVKNFRKGETIVTEGDAVDRFGAVLSGNIEVSTFDVYGNKSIILSGGRDFVFGDSLIILGITEYPVSIIALDDCQIMFFPSSDITGNENRTFSLNLMKILAVNNIDYRSKITVLQQRRTRDKILKFLSNEAKKNRCQSFSIPYDRQDLADYLGVERSAMATEIGKLVKEGLIKTKRKRFDLLTD